MPLNLGPVDIILILVIILVIFGAGRLPQAGTALGKTMKAFRTGKAEEEEHLKPRRKTTRRSA
jgi:sec-independent protein translocase protein TatA